MENNKRPGIILDFFNKNLSNNLRGFSGILMGRPEELSISDSLYRTRRKILKGQSKTYMVHLMDISLIVHRTDELAPIQSALACPKIHLLQPQKSLKNHLR